MTVPQKNALRRRHFARMLKSVFATTTLATMISLSATAMGQAPTCGCEPSSPACGVEFAGPSCGCEAPEPRAMRLGTLNSSPTAPSKVVSFRPRSLSFAEKFLKQLDRVGDQIEWEASRSTCSCAGNSAGYSAGPTCGCESTLPIPSASLPGCGCGPSIPFGLPNASSEAIRGTRSVQPFVNNQSRAGQGGGTNSPAENAPMFPHKPQDTQAFGKISDNGANSPKMTPPRPEKPVAAPVAPKTLSAAPDLTAPPSSDLSTSRNVNSNQGGNSGRPQRIPENEPNFLPQSRNTAPADRLPTLQPTPTEPQNSLPYETPSPLLPSALPQSQEEIPDVLIDPFKDDASWKSNRNRLNGVRLISGDMPNPLRQTSIATQESQLRLLPTPHNDESVAYDDPPPVVVKPKVINRYRSDGAETSPTVNRVAVPKKKL